MRSLAENNLKAEGTAALAKVLPETKIESLKCAATERMRRESDSAHYPHLAFSPDRVAPCTRSLADNNITNYGKDMFAVIKLAEVLSQTSIASLKCAAREMCLRARYGPLSPPARF